MTMAGAEATVARARALIGVRFRAQGRSADEGLDCIGLVAAALGLDGARDDYALRGGSAAELEAALAKSGMRLADRAEPGDVLVMQAGPGQLHLGLWTGDGLVHADAGLRRVVERPGEAPWPLLSVWRFKDHPAVSAGAEQQDKGRALRLTAFGSGSGQASTSSA